MDDSTQTNTYKVLRENIVSTTSGTSGSSGYNGANGTSGTSGSSGTAGTSGRSGSSGTSGTSGSEGTSGTSGTDGSSGTSGSNGSSGSGGTSGSSGTSPVDLNRTGLITTGSIATIQSITGSLIVSRSIYVGDKLTSTGASLDGGITLENRQVSSKITIDNPNTSYFEQSIYDFSETYDNEFKINTNKHATSFLEFNILNGNQNIFMQISGSFATGSAGIKPIQFLRNTEITGSLNITGSATITGSLTVSGSVGITGSLNVRTSGGNGINFFGGNQITTYNAGMTTASYWTVNEIGNNSTFQVSTTNGDIVINPNAAGKKVRILKNTEITGSLNVTGSAIITGSVQGNVNSLSISSNTASLNLNDGNFFTLQLVSGSATHLNPSNIKQGQTVSIFVNTTGSATMTFPSSVKQISGSAYVPTTTTGIDILTLISKDSSNLYLVNAQNFI